LIRLKRSKLCGECIPNAVKNEVELNEDTAEGQNSTHQDARQWFRVESLVRNLPGNLVDTDGIFQRLIKNIQKNKKRQQRFVFFYSYTTFESEICAEECQRHRYAEP
jgi:hypothetical protein